MMTIQEAISCLEGVLCGAELLETDVDDITDLLHEREPAKVTTRRIPANGGSIVWTCGKCGADLAPNNAKAKYCSSCGKAVKWE